MGFFDKQRAANDERIRALANEKLRSGETLKVALLANTDHSMFKLALAVLPGAFLLELSGRGSLSPLLIGGSMAVWFGFVVRQHFLVLTDQRFLSMRLRRFSTKKIDEVAGCELEEASGATLKKRLLSGVLSLKCGTVTQSYQVARIYDDRARDLVSQLSP
ncbi:MAG: hypothetical protein ACR2L3_00220 [Actinomycetota bacterium]